MDRVKMSATSREPGRNTSTLRKSGLVPAVLYGIGSDPVSISVNSREIERMVTTHEGLNIMIDMSIDGANEVLTRIRDLNADPVTRGIIHVDFQRLDLNRKINVDVPIHYEGKAKGLEDGGVLDIKRRTLTVRCLPTSVPDSIVIDVSAMVIGDSIHMDSVTLPAGVENPHEANFTLVVMAAPTKEEVVVAAPAEATAEVPATNQGAAKEPAAADAKSGAKADAKTK